MRRLIDKLCLPFSIPMNTIYEGAHFNRPHDAFPSDYSGFYHGLVLEEQRAARDQAIAKLTSLAGQIDGLIFEMVDDTSHPISQGMDEMENLVRLHIIEQHINELGANATLLPQVVAGHLTLQEYAQPLQERAQALVDHYTTNKVTARFTLSELLKDPNAKEIAETLQREAILDLNEIYTERNIGWHRTRKLFSGYAGHQASGDTGCAVIVAPAVAGGIIGACIKGFIGAYLGGAIGAGIGLGAMTKTTFDYHKKVIPSDPEHIIKETAHLRTQLTKIDENISKAYELE